MYTSMSKAGQSPFEVKKLRVMNRCGATALVLGDVVALDLDASQAETKALSGPGGATLSTLTEAMFANVVELAAAPVNALVGVVTDLLAGAGADNTEVEIAISGIVETKVGGTDWNNDQYDSCGVALMADTTGANRRLIAATDNPNTGKVGLIVEAINEDLSASNTTAKVLLFGWGSSVGPVGDA